MLALLKDNIHILRIETRNNTNLHCGPFFVALISLNQRLKSMECEVSRAFEKGSTL